MGISHRPFISKMDRIFFHIDVNSAFLSWSALYRLKQGDTVDIREIPSIVGGDQTKRHGIVLAKSVPAKKYGIETAEPVVNAFRKCPTLVNVEPNREFYSEMSHAMMDYLKTISPDIEQASIDECYMDFTPVSGMYESPLACADMIRTEIKNRFGFTVNVGISDRKVLAKMASDFQKPDRTHTLYASEIQKKMWPLSVNDLFLCGKSACRTLNKLGINTIGELATADLGVLSSNLKSHGEMLWRFANGIDDSVVVTEPPETKGVGNSTTLSRDVTDKEEASRILYELSESVSVRLNKHGFLASQISVEIKYATFKSVSRQTVLEDPVSTAKAIHAASDKLFDELWNGDPIRLLGIRTAKLSDVSEPVQMSLFDDAFSDSEAPETHDTEKQKNLEAALAQIRNKFGKDAVRRGSP